MNGPTKQTDRHVNAVLSALTVLDCFLSKPSLTIKQIVESTGYTRNHVMRLIGTLQHKRYVLQDSSLGTYMPGPQVWALHKVFEKEHSLVRITRPTLQEIVMKTGESASLYVRNGLERVVLAREEGTWALRYNFLTEGEHLEMHSGAAGKVLLAYAPDDIQKAIFESKDLIKRTPKTITDPVALQEEIKKVRQQGYAESYGERVSDTGSLSAPVFDSTGNIMGALALAGALSRFTPETTRKYIQIVVDAAQRLSAQLGWTIAIAIANEDQR